jgi:hypothetical protein
MPLELLRQLHRPQRLPIALGLGVPEVAVDLLLGIAPAPFVVPNQEDRFPFVAGEPCHDGVIVGKAPVPADFGELGEQAVDIVEYRWAVLMPRHKDTLPRRQLGVDLGTDRLDSPVQAVNRLLVFSRSRQYRKRLDLLQQDADRRLKLEDVRRHRRRQSL